MELAGLMAGPALLATLLGGLSGCSGQPSEPAAGILEVHLSSPHSDDGALLFTVTGGSVDSVEAAGYTVYSSRAGVSQLEVIVTGDLTSGTIARLHIPDARRAPSIQPR